MVRSGLCIVILLLFAGRSHAQERLRPFATLELRLGGTQNVNSNFLHEFWAHGFGLEGGFTTPFYLGYAEMGGAVHRYRVNESAAVPGFDALLLYAGWGLDKAFSRLHLEGGVRIGNDGSNGAGALCDGLVQGGDGVHLRIADLFCDRRVP